MSEIFFQGCLGLLRVLIVGFLAYTSLIVLLRISGKRTLSKMNAFDLIATVALGSTLATVILSKEVALMEGIFAFSVLIFLQFAITWLSTRWKTLEKLVKSEPSLLFFRGQYLEEVMRTERITTSEIKAAVRAKGLMSIEAASAVVLETDGSLSVLENTSGTDGTSPDLLPLHGESSDGTTK